MIKNKYNHNRYGGRKYKIVNKYKIERRYQSWWTSVIHKPNKNVGYFIGLNKVMP